MHRGRRDDRVREPKAATYRSDKSDGPTAGTETVDPLAWQTGHLALFTRYGGVPRRIRVDNVTTAVASGAGPTAVLNAAFTTFARACGFAVDP